MFFGGYPTKLGISLDNPRECQNHASQKKSHDSTGLDIPSSPGFYTVYFGKFTKFLTCPKMKLYLKVRFIKAKFLEKNAYGLSDSILKCPIS